MNLNDSFRYLHMGVPDDIARLQGIVLSFNGIGGVAGKQHQNLVKAVVMPVHLLHGGVFQMEQPEILAEIAPAQGGFLCHAHASFCVCAYSIPCRAY